MRLLGLIPAKATSRRFPGKHMAMLGGQPLITWTMMAAQMSGILEWIVVSTDDAKIMALAIKRGFAVHERPAWIKDNDWPTRLKAALHNTPEAEAIVLLQATSPLRAGRHIVEAVDAWQTCGGDSLVSVNENREVNGAIYICSAERIRRGDSIYDDNSLRFWMPDSASVDIDYPADLARAEQILKDRKR